MRKPIIAITFLIIVILYLSLFIVQEGQRGVMLRFGNVLQNDQENNQVYVPGIHFKIPFIDRVKFLDARIHTTNDQVDFITKDKKNLIIDSYITWYINDFNRYYLVTKGNISQGESLLKREFSNQLRTKIGNLNIKNILINSNSSPVISRSHNLNINSKLFSNVIQNEINIHQSLIDINLSSLNTLGIHVVDSQIKNISLSKEVTNIIYNNMRVEREAIARFQQSKGQEEAEKIRSQADYEIIKKLAEAQHTALILHSEAEAKATKLFADAFSQNPELYTFIRRLRAYENIFHNQNDILVLSTSSDFFRYMKAPAYIKDHINLR